jgi:hypothetical protein
MRSKFAIWSDEGILSKPRATGFARIRGIIVVGSVCGIAAASVYSQIGPDRGTLATDRAGYGTEGRPAQQQRAPLSEPSNTLDAYARSGATTGATSLSSTGVAPKSPAKLAPRSAVAEPTSIAATPESTAKPGHPSAPSELTRMSPDPAARSAPKSDAADVASATAETNAEPDKKAAHPPGSLEEKRRGTRRSARSGFTRSRDDSYAAFESREGRNGFMAFGPPPDGRNKGYAEFEPWDRRVRNEDSRGSRRYPSQSSPFNWFAMPFQ